jgi:hypothetical protein
MPRPDVALQQTSKFIEKVCIVAFYVQKIKELFFTNQLPNYQYCFFLLFYSSNDFLVRKICAINPPTITTAAVIKIPLLLKTLI